MFKERLISGIILVLIAVVTLYFGGLVTFGVVLAISLMGQFEFLRAFEQEKKHLSYISYALTIGYYMVLIFCPEYSLAYMVLTIMIIMGCYVFTFPRYDSKDILAYVFSFAYVVLFLSYIYQIRMLKDGGFLIVLVFLASWGSDTLAYCAGRLLGKHKMTPVLSPKKTIEGAAGGIIGAALLGFLYACIVKGNMNVVYNPMILFPVICFFGAFLSIIGDLAASAIKRNQDIKDYSHLIPGHGGILDRFDSIMFTAPIVFYLAVILGGH